MAVDDSATLTANLTNGGDTELELLSVSLIEGETSVWSVDRDPGDVLAGGASIELRVGFGPIDVGDFSGRIQIRSTDDANANLYVSLEGIGTPSETDYDGDGYAAADGDCDESSATVHPGAEELCDGADDDCDGQIPADEADDDYDGWRVCDADCDDGDALVYPGAAEICDGKDSDCDGINADEADSDGDGFSICDGDCADSEPSASPGQPESCDGLDNDCSGLADDIDEDGDGHSPCDPAPDCDDQDAEAYPVVISPEGSDADGDGSAGAPLETLEAAIAQLDATCRTIYLMPGAYEIALQWSADALTLAGAAPLDAAEDSEVVVSPPAGARIFELTGGTLRLEGMTLTGADVEGDGGAVEVVSARLETSRVRFEGNRCSNDGGAIKVSAGELITSRTTFQDNTADDDGGAVYAASSVYRDADSSYRSNRAVRGGGVVAETTDLSMTGAVFRQNTASDEGGGLAVLGVTAIALEDSDFSLNSAGSRGGGVVLVDVADLDGQVRNNTFSDNAAGDVGGGLALYGSAAVLSLSNNTVTGNAAPGEGAGIWVGATDASGLVVWSNIVAWSQGASGLYAEPDAGGEFAWNLGYATSNVDYDFAGALTAGADSNLVENPEFVAYSDDGDPDDDDLTLQPGSPAEDSGPLSPDWNDPDGSRNDRGATGGPGA